jgi:uncharacterized protein (DUF4415 family)
MSIRTPKRFDREPTMEELAAMTDEDIDFSDIPETDEEFWKNAVLVMPDRTKAVTLRIKSSVIDAFKEAGTRGYQTRMNAVLETYARDVLAKKRA